MIKQLSLLIFLSFPHILLCMDIHQIITKAVLIERSDFLINNKFDHHQWYVGGSFSKDIALLDIVSGKRHVALKGHDGPIRCCIETQKGNLLLSGSNDETIKIWDTRNNALIGTFDACHNRVDPNFGDIAFCLAQEEDHFCSSTVHDRINMRDMATGKTVWHVHGNNIINTRSLATCTRWFAAWSIMMRNNLLYLGSGNGTLSIIDLRCGRITFQNHAHKRQIPCLVPCKNSDVHFYSGSHDGVVNRWDMRNCQLIALGTHDYGVSCLYESTDSKKLFSGGADGIRIWDATGQTEQPLSIVQNFDALTTVADNKIDKQRKILYVDSIATNDETTELYISSSQGIHILALKK